MSARSWMRDGLCAVGFVTLAFATPSQADETIKLTHQGVERTAILYRPAKIDPSGRRPLVIALHGITQSTQDLRGQLLLDAAADREGFVVLYPEAVELTWSYGRPVGRPGPLIGDEPVDDIGFIRRLIDDLINRNIIDPARIYVAGVSRGGLMAFTLACALDDRVAAVAPFITGMTDNQREDCRPARPVPIMVIAGTEDPIQPYDGWILSMGRLLSVPETMEFWRLLHGCTGQTGKLLSHRERSDRTHVVRIDWEGCRNDAQVRLYRVSGGGHQLPSLAVSAEETAKRFGQRNRDFETGNEVWDFFKSISR
jgi:polyhydroxybutyrate depolymerase